MAQVIKPHVLLHWHLPKFSYFFLQDRLTFRRIILKNNAKKRKKFESFIESLPLLRSLEVKSSEEECLWGFKKSCSNYSIISFQVILF